MSKYPLIRWDGDPTSDCYTTVGDVRADCQNSKLGWDCIVDYVDAKEEDDYIFDSVESKIQPQTGAAARLLCEWVIRAVLAEDVFEEFCPGEVICELPLEIQKQRCKEKTERGNIYPSHKKANAAVMKVKKKRPCKTLKAFLCPVCNRWHIGNNRYKTTS